MANVLGELFGNIANAIREKTGNTESMKPAEFPEKIRSITSGGAEIKRKEGSFSGTDKIMTVNHNIGQVPDIIFVWADHMPVENCIFIAVGFSAAMYEALGGGFIANLIALKNGGSFGFSNNASMETSNSNSETYGNIRNCTATSFTIGGSMFQVNTQKVNGYAPGYSYVAFYGIL